MAESLGIPLLLNELFLRAFTFCACAPNAVWSRGAKPSFRPRHSNPEAWESGRSWLRAPPAISSKPTH